MKQQKGLKWGKSIVDKELLEVCKRETAALTPDEASDWELESSGGNEIVQFQSLLKPYSLRGANWGGELPEDGQELRFLSLMWFVMMWRALQGGPVINVKLLRSTIGTQWTDQCVWNTNVVIFSRHVKSLLYSEWGKQRQMLELNLNLPLTLKKERPTFNCNFSLKVCLLLVSIIQSAFAAVSKKAAADP